MKEAIRPIIEGGLGQIDRFMVERTASAAVARAGLQDPTPIAHNRKEIIHAEVQDLSAALQSTAAEAELKNSGYPTAQDQSMMRAHSTYQPAMSVYTDAGVDSTAHFYPSYDPSNNAYQSMDARMTNQSQVPPNAEAYMFNHQNAYPPQHVSSGVMAWRQWTETLKDHIEPTDYMNHPANALMALTGREMGQVDAAPVLQDMATAASMHHAVLGTGVGNAHQWPMNAYAVKDIKHS